MGALHTDHHFCEYLGPAVCSHRFAIQTDANTVLTELWGQGGGSESPGTAYLSAHWKHEGMSSCGVEQCSGTLQNKYLIIKSNQMQKLVSYSVNPHGTVNQQQHKNNTPTHPPQKTL